MPVQILFIDTKVEYSGVMQKLNFQVTGVSTSHLSQSLPSTYYF